MKRGRWQSVREAVAAFPLWAGRCPGPSRGAPRCSVCAAGAGEGADWAQGQSRWGRAAVMPVGPQPESTNKREPGWDTPTHQTT